MKHRTKLVALLLLVVLFMSLRGTGSAVAPTTDDPDANAS